MLEAALSNAAPKDARPLGQARTKAYRRRHEALVCSGAVSVRTNETRDGRGEAILSSENPHSHFVCDNFWSTRTEKKLATRPKSLQVSHARPRRVVTHERSGRLNDVEPRSERRGQPGSGVKARQSGFSAKTVSNTVL